MSSQKTTYGGIKILDIFLNDVREMYMILRNDRKKIISRLDWQPKKPKIEPIGIGSLGYHISLSEQDDFIHITFLAKPLRSDRNTIYDYIEVNINCTFDEKCIAFTIKDIKDNLLKTYPDPENYFNKIEPIQECSNEKTLFISCDEVRGVHMTKEYLDNTLKTLGELLEDVIRNPQIRQQNPTMCAIF